MNPTTDQTTFTIADIPFLLIKVGENQFRLESPQASAEAAYVSRMISDMLYQQYDCECEIIDLHQNAAKVRDIDVYPCRGITIEIFPKEVNANSWVEGKGSKIHIYEPPNQPRSKPLDEETLKAIISVMAGRIPTLEALHAVADEQEKKEAEIRKANAEYYSSLTLGPTYAEVSGGEKVKVFNYKKFQIGGVEVILAKLEGQLPLHITLEAPVTGVAPDLYLMIKHALASQKLDCEPYLIAKKNDRFYPLSFGFSRWQDRLDERCLSKKDREQFEELMGYIEQPAHIVITRPFGYSKEQFARGLKTPEFEDVAAILTKLQDKTPSGQLDFSGEAEKLALAHAEKQKKLKTLNDRQYENVVRQRMNTAIQPYYNAAAQFFQDQKIAVSEPLMKEIEELLITTHYLQNPALSSSLALDRIRNPEAARTESAPYYAAIEVCADGAGIGLSDQQREKLRTQIMERYLSRTPLQQLY
jgi:hypothetical protein